MLKLKHISVSVVVGWLIGVSSIHAADASLNFTISRAATPRLYFKYLTLKVNTCGATSATVTVDGQAVASTVTGGNVVFTTAGNNAVVNLVGTTTATGLGQFTKAVLKDDKKWAWSHGLDDNYDESMNPQINAFKTYGYTGTCFWNGIALPWYPVNIPTAVSAHWTIGNHTWSHEGADGPALSDNLEVTQCDDAIIEALADAGVPNYIVNTFANPYFNGKWNTVVRNLYNSGQTDIVLLETGWTPCKFICDPGASAAGDYTPISLTNLPVVIGRDFSAYGNVNSTTDYMHSHSDDTHHLWYNSGNDAPNASGSAASSAVSRIHSQYDDEAWVASSAEVYDYLLTAGNSTVTYTTAVVRSYVPALRASDDGAGRVFDLRGRAVAAGRQDVNAALCAEAPGVYLITSLSGDPSALRKIVVR
jgi:hypothetical protein